MDIYSLQYPAMFNSRSTSIQYFSLRFCYAVTCSSYADNNTPYSMNKSTNEVVCNIKMASKCLLIGFKITIWKLALIIFIFCLPINVSINVSESILKIKMKSCWPFFQIFLTLEVICKQRLFYELKIVQYLQNCKCYYLYQE